MVPVVVIQGRVETRLGHPVTFSPGHPGLTHFIKYLGTGLTVQLEYFEDSAQLKFKSCLTIFITFMQDLRYFFSVNIYKDSINTAKKMLHKLSVGAMPSLRVQEYHGYE